MLLCATSVRGTLTTNMEGIFSELVVRTVFGLGTGIVVGVVVCATKRGVFFGRLAQGSVVFVVCFATIFLMRQHLSGAMAEDVASSSTRMIIGAIHGITSLFALSAALILFAQARSAYQRKVNFFANHPVWARCLVGAWIVALGTGMLL